MAKYATITITKEDKEIIKKVAKKEKRSLANLVMYLVCEHEKKGADVSSTENNI